MSTEPQFGTLAGAGDAAAIITAAREHAEPHAIDPAEPKVHAFVVPAGSKLEKVTFDETYLERPRRLKGSVSVEDVASFAAYVAEFYAAERTTAWVDMTGHRVTAILDDAHRDRSAWREHRATLQLRRTPEWTRWRSNDNQLMLPEAFAEHIEDSEVEIVAPSAAELLEIAQTFHGSTKSEFRAGTRLKSGEVHFEWVEETTASAGKRGELEIPDKFELSVAPFHGEDRCAVTALLRFRVRDGKLAIGYKLVRPDDVERDAMELIAEKLRASIDRVYLGSPNAR